MKEEILNSVAWAWALACCMAFYDLFYTAWLNPDYQIIISVNDLGEGNLEAVLLAVGALLLAYGFIGSLRKLGKSLVVRWFG